MSDISSLHPLTRKLLLSRGIETDEEIKKFIAPDYERDTYDPFLILNMEKAVMRILEAIKEEEPIIIYGDYDCDGIPGSVVLHDFFTKIGYAHFLNYIPHRHHEGYGLNKDAIEHFASEGVALIITVDCGITDVDEVLLAQDLGIDVIITDHHLPQAVLPPAYAIINSKQEGDTYPDPMLCGAGVAFKLVQALLLRGKFEGVGIGWEKWLLDMAGLATIADMVPLQNENRVLAYFGLKVLKKSPRPGLQALLRKAGVAQEHLTEEDVGFTIGPRINAASRMDIPFHAFEMLSTSDIVLAKERALYLDTLNDTRKLEVARMTKEARKLLHERELREVIVIGNPSWRVGVVGIVANKLAEEFDRPAFVWGKEGSTHIKGSCRSDGRVNIVELMVAVRDGVFLDKGGHEFSGGFSVATEHIHYLEDELVKAHHVIFKKETKPEAYTIDATLLLRDIHEATFRAIDILAPFGIGNPRPHFLIERAQVIESSQFGKEKNHLKLILGDDAGSRVSALGFFMSPEDFPEIDLSLDREINIVATLEKSYFRGRPELRLRIIDIRK